MRNHSLAKRMLAILIVFTVCTTLVPTAALAAAPPPPKGLKATAISATSVKLTWKKTSKAKSYTVYKKSGAKYVKIAVPKKNTYTVKKLKPATKYSFRVAVKTAGGVSKLCKAVSVRTKATAATPTPTPLPTPAMSEAPPQAYGQEAPPPQEKRIPLTPTGFKGTSPNPKTIVLTWDKMEFAEEYLVYEYVYIPDSPDHPPDLIATVPAKLTTVTTKGNFSWDGSHNYYIRAKNSLGQSPLSQSITVWPKRDDSYVGALAAPATSSLNWGYYNVSDVGDAAYTRVALFWGYVEGAEYYNIYYADSPDTAASGTAYTYAGKWMDDGVNNEQTCDMTGLKPGKTYYFRLASVNGAGEEGPLSEAIAATAPAMPAAPKPNKPGFYVTALDDLGSKIRVHFKRDFLFNTGQITGLRQYYSTDGGKSWLLEDDVDLNEIYAANPTGGGDPAFYMDFPKGAMRSSKFTAMNGTSESDPYYIMNYAVAMPPTNVDFRSGTLGGFGAGEPGWITFNWTAAPGAAKYNIYMRYGMIPPTIDGPWQYVGSTMSNSFNCSYTSSWPSGLPRIKVFETFTYKIVPAVGSSEAPFFDWGYCTIGT